MLRIATYNIHKGVQGIGPRRRLEIHNLGQAIQQFDADIICLQEVRKHHHSEARHFANWPAQPQADYLAPEGYHAVYRTNATTRHGEHGNALLSRWPVLGHWHEDISDHRFEQRGLLHVALSVQGRALHVVVVHFGLIPASRLRQAAQLGRYIAAAVPAQAPLVVAGDFNDWGDQVRRVLAGYGLQASGTRCLTYPARLPIVQLDHIYLRNLRLLSLQVPHCQMRGMLWSQMSDHLPLLAELEWSGEATHGRVA
jgi:endonuclease/exonuclease/phosphatase family metal-dependent hydrolase